MRGWFAAVLAIRILAPSRNPAAGSRTTALISGHPWRRLRPEFKN